MRMQVLLILAGAVALTAGCSHRPGKYRHGATVERLPKVEVSPPSRRRLQRRVDLAATVEALQRVELAARVPGVVRRVAARIDIGRRVKQGETLLRLEVPDLEADRDHKVALLEQAHKMKKLAEKSLEVAKAEVSENEKEEKRFEADAAFARGRLKRIRGLVQQNAQDPLLAEEALRQSESAEAALAVNQARRAKLEGKVQAALAELDLAAQRIVVAQTEVQKLNAVLAFATVKAPFDGVITRRWVDSGAIIKDPGATLLTVMQIDRVRVLIDVPQRDVPLLNTREQNPNPDGQGDSVDLYLPALAGAPGSGKFHGTVTRKGQSLDPVTRTMRAEIEMANPEGALQPGMYGTASVLVEDRSDVLTVPATALVRRGEERVEVFIVAGAKGHGNERRGVLRRIPVVLGVDDGKNVEVRHGLKGDELIVARGNGAMRADDPVIAVSERETPEK